jgi:hypothetical protein
MKIGDRILYEEVVMNIDLEFMTTSKYKGTVIDIQDPYTDKKWLIHKTVIEFDEDFKGYWVTGKIHSFHTDIIIDHIEINLKETRNHKLKELGI